MKVAYFAHDIEDPAIARRVLTLRAGGADVVVIGFWRSDERRAPEGARVISLGRLHDGRLIHRIGAVLLAFRKLAALREELRHADVIVARNLDILFLAERAKRVTSSRAPLVYECLDIHRAMFGTSVTARLLRALERRLLRASSLLLVSSPAFVSHYFRAVQQTPLPVLLVENKVLQLEQGGEGMRDASARKPGPPWRIGWFGVIRCRRSLDVLARITREHPGLCEIVIRGRPVRSVFDNFDATIAAHPGMSYEGPYERRELPELYADVHFAWAIDFYEEGLNSNWLLPNRLYESLAYGVTPIALRDVETGAWLARHGSGLLIDAVDKAKDALLGMSSAKYASLAGQSREVPLHDVVMSREDCVDIVQTLAVLAPLGPSGQP